MNGVIDSVLEVLTLVLLYQTFAWFASEEETRRAQGAQPRRWWWLRALPYTGVVVGLIVLVGWWRMSGGTWVTPPATIDAMRAEQRYEAGVLAAGFVFLLAILQRERLAVEGEMGWRTRRGWVPRWWVVSAGAALAAVAAWWVLD